MVVEVVQSVPSGGRTRWLLTSQQAGSREQYQKQANNMVLLKDPFLPSRILISKVSITSQNITTN